MCNYEMNRTELLNLLRQAKRTKSKSTELSGTSNSPRWWHWVQPAGRRHTHGHVQEACSHRCCGGGQIPPWSWGAAAWSRLWCRASSGPAEPADGVNDALGSHPATADSCKRVLVYVCLYIRSFLYPLLFSQFPQHWSQINWQILCKN